jgi:hypothetical protein
MEQMHIRGILCVLDKLRLGLPYCYHFLLFDWRVCLPVGCNAYQVRTFLLSFRRIYSRLHHTILPKPVQHACTLTIV